MSRRITPSDIMGYILKRPVTDKMKLKSMLKNGYGISIPTFFGGRKKEVFNDFSTAIYLVSTEAILLDAAVALGKYFEEDPSLISDNTLEIFEQFSGKNQLTRALHIGVSTTYHEIGNPSDAELLGVSWALFSEWIPLGVSKLHSLAPCHCSPSGTYYQELISILADEATRVLLDAIQKTDSEFRYTPFAYASLESDILRFMSRGL